MDSGKKKTPQIYWKYILESHKLYMFGEKQIWSKNKAKNSENILFFTDFAFFLNSKPFLGLKLYPKHARIFLTIKNMQKNIFSKFFGKKNVFAFFTAQNLKKWLFCPFFSKKRAKTKIFKKRAKAYHNVYQKNFSDSISSSNALNHSWNLENV